MSHYCRGGDSGENEGVNPGLLRSAQRAAALAVGGLVPAIALTLWSAPAALAHGGVVPTVPPDPANLVLGWKGDPLVWLPAIVALVLWWTGVRQVNRAHPANPVPRARTWSWVAGVLAIVFALDSGIERYDTSLFWVHMIQHMLLTLVAPILLLHAGPITLLLRASSAATRRRWIFPFLHSRVIRFVSFPVVSWLLFAAVMWASHFSPLFDAALEDQWVHRLEHALFLGAALLFWWPVVGPDPSPWRMKPAAKVLYVGLQMPQNTFLALAIYMSTIPLYQHYVSTVRAWGPTPLEDQQMAGGVMWLGGDLVFLGMVILLVFAWMRAEERQTVGEDRRLGAEEAAIRERAARLAERKAAEGTEAAGGVRVGRRPQGPPAAPIRDPGVGPET
jgi:cytochrome c oxidase assembly factor CtaG